MLDLDLNDPVNQVRAMVGDVDGSYISDNNIQFLLTKYNNVVSKASLAALDYILNIVAYYTREEAGDVEIYWQDIFNQLSKRRELLNKENAYAISGSLFKFGGTIKSEMDRVNTSLESQGIGIRKSDFSSILSSYGIDPDNPYILTPK